MQTEEANVNAERTRVEIDHRHGDVVSRVYFESRGAALTPCPEAYATLALLPSMRRGCHLEVAEPLDPQFQRGLENVQRRFCAWSPRFEPIEVRCPDGEPAATQAASAGVGSFFSGGHGTERRNSSTSIFYFEK